MASLTERILSRANQKTQRLMAEYFQMLRGAAFGSNKAFTGEVSNDGKTVKSADGRTYNANPLGNPGKRYDATLPITSDQAVHMDEDGRKLSDEGRKSSLEYVLQGLSHYYKSANSGILYELPFPSFQSDGGFDYIFWSHKIFTNSSGKLCVLQYSWKAEVATVQQVCFQRSDNNIRFKARIHIGMQLNKPTDGGSFGTVSFTEGRADIERFYNAFDLLNLGNLQAPETSAIRRFHGPHFRNWVDFSYIEPPQNVLRTVTIPEQYVEGHTTFTYVPDDHPVPHGNGTFFPYVNLTAGEMPAVPSTSYQGAFELAFPERSHFNLPVNVEVYGDSNSPYGCNVNLTIPYRVREAAYSYLTFSELEVTSNAVSHRWDIGRDTGFSLDSGSPTALETFVANPTKRRLVALDNNLTAHDVDGGLLITANRQVLEDISAYKTLFPIVIDPPGETPPIVYTWNGTDLGSAESLVHSGFSSLKVGHNVISGFGDTFLKIRLTNTRESRGDLFASAVLSVNHIRKDSTLTYTKNESIKGEANDVIGIARWFDRLEIANTIAGYQPPFVPPHLGAPPIEREPAYFWYRVPTTFQARNLFDAGENTFKPCVYDDVYIHGVFHGEFVLQAIHTSHTIHIGTLRSYVPSFEHGTIAHQYQPFSTSIIIGQDEDFYDDYVPYLKMCPGDNYFAVTIPSNTLLYMAGGIANLFNVANYGTVDLNYLRCLTDAEVVAYPETDVPPSEPQTFIGFPTALPGLRRPVSYYQYETDFSLSSIGTDVPDHSNPPGDYDITIQNVFVRVRKFAGDQPSASHPTLAAPFFNAFLTGSSLQNQPNDPSVEVSNSSNSSTIYSEPVNIQVKNRVSGQLLETINMPLVSKSFLPLPINGYSEPDPFNPGHNRWAPILIWSCANKHFVIFNGDTPGVLNNAFADACRVMSTWESPDRLYIAGIGFAFADPDNFVQGAIFVSDREYLLKNAEHFANVSGEIHFATLDQFLAAYFTAGKLKDYKLSTFSAVQGQFIDLVIHPKAIRTVR